MAARARAQQRRHGGARGGQQRVRQRHVLRRVGMRARAAEGEHRGAFADRLGRAQHTTETTRLRTRRKSSASAAARAASGVPASHSARTARRSAGRSGDERCSSEEEDMFFSQRRKRRRARVFRGGGECVMLTWLATQLTSQTRAACSSMASERLTRRHATRRSSRCVVCAFSHHHNARSHVRS